MNYASWNIPDIAAAPPQLLAAGYSPLLAAVLHCKGLDDRDAAEAYLHCGPETLSDPMRMADMPVAVRRIRRAIETREHLAVYGDYDVDGITAASMLTEWLRSKGLETELYIPDRIGEGYGLNAAAIEDLYRRGVRLLITVDCGVTALAEAETAAQLGMDIIITDHHECQAELPNCCAVVDPKRPDCPGSSMLAGVGVAFKLMCAVDGESDSLLDTWGDLVAIGTIADVMPLLDENRYIVRRGLESISMRPRPGLAALLTESGIVKKPLHAITVGFTLAPRINAAGRLGRAELAAELLLCRDTELCTALARELCALNYERQLVQQEIWQEAEAMLAEEAPDGPIVLAKEGWHQGVVGIATSRLTDAYSLPAIMICLDGDHGKGSCRSFGGFNLFEALSACSDTLESYGGHALAAGLNIKKENIPAFRKAIKAYYDAHPPCREKVLQIDLHIGDGRMMDFGSIEELELLEPCGSGNPRPTCCVTDAVLESVTPTGGGKHLRLRLNKFDRSFSCIFFSQTEEALGAQAGDFVDAAFSPQINEYRGHRNVQLVIEDLRPADPLPLCRALLRGEIPAGAEKDLFTPVRTDFVALWNRLKRMGGTVSGEALPTLRLLADGAHPALISCCLAVFAQTGLADVLLRGDELELRLNFSAAKADLESAPLMRKLRER